MYSTPILYIFFKRPDLVKRTFEPIKKIKPKTLYLFQDGSDDPEVKKKILEARRIILNMIDWDCQVKKYFQKTNLGVTNHAISALNKFFQDQEYGVYIEDDILVNKEFFKFQDCLLKKYKNDKRIFAINPFNPFSEKIKEKKSYYLSQICFPWGLGLWRRSWRLYDLHCHDYLTVFAASNKKNFFSPKYFFYLKNYIEAINKRGYYNRAWDIPLNYAAVKNKSHIIRSTKNLVNNIGFNIDGSNPFISNYYREIEPIFPLHHPKQLIYKKRNDKIFFNNLLKGGWIRLILIRIYLFSPKILKQFLEGLIVRMNKLRKLIFGNRENIIAN